MSSQISRTLCYKMSIYLFKFLKQIKKTIFRRKIVIGAILFMFILHILKKKTQLYLYLLSSLKLLENVSCYNVLIGDALPAIGDGFSPPAKSIYFHETSCRGQLNTRQACAVESAARAHPDWQIYLFFTASVTNESLNNGSLRALKKYQNIKFMRVNLVEYARGTPLESMVTGGGLNWSRWRISHTSDALRYLSLYKWGGVYLDLDMVVARSFDELAPNWAAEESDRTIAAGALAFSRDKMGRRVAEEALGDFRDNFRGDLWGNNGPGVITRILCRMCGTAKVSEMSANSCKGFEVYGRKLFYPIRWEEAEEYFDSKELNVGCVFCYHVWNKLTMDWRVDRESVYMKLAKKYCPVIYTTYGDSFGT